MVDKSLLNFGPKISALNDNFNCGIAIAIATFGTKFFEQYAIPKTQNCKHNLSPKLNYLSAHRNHVFKFLACAGHAIKNSLKTK